MSNYYRKQLTSLIVFLPKLFSNVVIVISEANCPMKNETGDLDSAKRQTELQVSRELILK